MKFKNEKLVKLLKLIEEISNQQDFKWFKDELTNMLNVTMLTREDDSLSVEPFLRLQRKIFRTKGLEFYKNVAEDNLRIQLTKDFQEMLWYKVLNQVDRQYLFTYYQIENMINFFITKNLAHEKIRNNSNNYVIEFSEKFIVTSYNYFFSKNGDPIDVTKISSIYAKIAFWAIETNNKSWILDKSRKFHLDNVVQIRNLKGHRNSQGDNPFVLANIEKIKKGDDSNYGFLIAILSRIKSTL
jgi:hypothetical protein